MRFALFIFTAALLLAGCRTEAQTTNGGAHAAIIMTNGRACVEFEAAPWIHYRLERTLALPAAHWLAADTHEATPYHLPVVLCDAGAWPAAFYRVTALGGGQ